MIPSGTGGLTSMRTSLLAAWGLIAVCVVTLLVPSAALAVTDYGDYSIRSCYDFESAATNGTDATGQYNLTQLGTLTYAAGKVGNAITAGWSNANYFNTPENSVYTDIFRTNRNTTWAFWAKITQASTLTTDRTTDANGMFTTGPQPGNGTWSYYYHNGAGIQTATYSNALSWDGSWHRLVFTQNTNGSSCQYTDGVLKSCVTVSSMASRNTTYYLGWDANGGEFKGALDVLTLANELWDQTTITDDYNGGAGRNCSYLITASSAPPASVPNITLASRSADLTDNTLFNTPFYVNWTYSVYNLGIGDSVFSSILLNFSVSSTALTCIQAVNGTCVQQNGTFETKSYYGPLIGGPYSNASINLTENDAYPYTENLAFSTAVTSLTNTTLNGNNYYLADLILNLSKNTTANFYEVPAASTGVIRVSYFNSSYDFNSNPATNSNVVEFCVITNGTAYNHTHFNGAWAHHLCPYSVNATGYLGSVKFNNGGFLIRGNPQNVYVTTYTGSVRSNVSYLTTNSGNTWAVDVGTVVSHVHQFTGNDTVCGQGIVTYTTSARYNTTFTCDTLQAEPTPPTNPQITTPTGGTYARYINITYNPSVPTYIGATIRYYNLSVYNDDATVNTTIRANNSVNLSFYWDAHILPLLRTGVNYYIGVLAVDSNGLSALDLEPFNLSTNAHFNLTLRNKWSNNTVPDFTGYAENTALGLNNTFENYTTPGGRYVNVISPNNYTLYFYATNYSVGPENNATVEITTNSKNYTHLLYSNNSIIVNVLSQTNGSPILTNTTVEFIGTIYRVNYTTTGVTFNDQLPDGTYDIQLSAPGFLTNIYTTTVTDRSTQTINAYLLLNTTTYGTVVFTVYDIESNSVLQGASIGAYRFVNGTRVLVESHYTDITGRAQFNYVPSTNYQFIVSATGYTAETFLLSPIIFNSYDIKLRQTNTYSSDMIFSGVNVYYTPKTFNKNTTTPFSIYFYAGNGTLSNYNYSISYPGGYASGSGSNSQGGSFNTTISISQAITTYEYINLTYCYTKVSETPNCFSVQTQIAGYSGRGTLAAFARDNYGMSIFESSMIVVIIAVLLAGIGALTVGPALGTVMGLGAFVIFAAAGFISWWIVIPSLIVGVMLILRGGGL